MGLLIFYIYLFYSSRKKLREEFSTKFFEFMEIVLLFNIFSCFYRDIFSRILTLTMLLYNIYFLIYLSKCTKKQLTLIIPIILLFCIALGSVNINNILENDYNNIFENMNENIFYFVSN